MFTGLALAFSLITNDIKVWDPIVHMPTIEVFEMWNYKTYAGRDRCEYVANFYVPEMMAVIADCRRTFVDNLIELETRYYAVITLDNAGRFARYRPSEMSTGQQITLFDWLAERELIDRR